MSRGVKYIYLTALIGGILLVGVGQMILIVRVANGRSSGDGFYQTNSEERRRIHGRTRGAHSMPDLNGQVAAEDSNAVEPAARGHAIQPDPIPERRDRVVAVAANNATRIVSRPNETIDVTVAGSGNSVTIKSGTRLARLTIAGTSNTVTFEKESSVRRVSVAGNDNVVIVPEAVEFRTTNSGLRTQFIRSDVIDAQSPTSIENADKKMINP